MIDEPGDSGDQSNISKIVIGNIKGIREDNHKSSKINSTIHNFWNFYSIIQRLKEKAEECGIEVMEINEYEDFKYMSEMLFR